MLIYAYHPKNSEKHQIQLLTQQERVRRIHAQRKCESPPTHIEREWGRMIDSRQGKYKPYQPETPHEQRDEQSHGVRDRSRYGVDRFVTLDDFAQDFPKIQNPTVVRSNHATGNKGLTRIRRSPTVPAARNN
jgi:hypothetical protein